MTVSRVRIDAQAEGAVPVVVALDMQNPNDYTLSTTRVELELVAGRACRSGGSTRTAAWSVPRGYRHRRAAARVPDANTTPARLQAFGRGCTGSAIAGPGYVRDSDREAEGPVRPGGRAGLRRATFASIRSNRSRCVTVRVIAPNSSSTFPRKMNGP